MRIQLIASHVIIMLKIHLLFSIVTVTSAFQLLATAPITTTSLTAIRESSHRTSNQDEKQLETPIMNRRSLLMSLVVAGTLSVNGPSMIARADDVLVPEPASVAPVVANLESVYFGVGCFWHIQHEFVVAERDLLGRSDRELTAFTGYAGGTAADKFGRVCYHNFQNVADYDKYGHGEVVGMKLPTDKIVDFAKVYFSLYNPKTLDRVDPQDRGGEYRSLIGLPGGTLHPLYPAIEEAASTAGFKLQVGRGNDPDTLGKQIVYVYDTATFPFYQAEIYHQFHNDFQSPAYGATYNKLADLAFTDGRIQTTGCPDKV